MKYFAGDYDIAVIGAGHAGCEAGLAAARMGMKTLIFSISLEAVANMPCNPHIGGSSKGHLVREIDALGGEMGKNIDKANEAINNDMPVDIIAISLNDVLSNLGEITGDVANEEILNEIFSRFCLGK